MQIVIDISEDRYKQVCEEQWLPNRLYFEKAIADGKPLEKEPLETKATELQKAYNKGFEDATTHWQQESNKKLSELASKKDKERAELEAKLVADFSHDLRLRDERLLEFENFVQANRDRKCSADERNSIIRVAIGFEEVAVKAIRLLEAERKN